MCEPRHASWFCDEAEQLLLAAQIARAGVDPAPVPEAAQPGGWPGLVYYRLHGSPQMYESPYSSACLETLEQTLRAAAQAAPTWCIFDNTALGAAMSNALELYTRLIAVNKRLEPSPVTSRSPRTSR